MKNEHVACGIQRIEEILSGNIGPKTTCDFETDARDTYPKRIELAQVELSVLEEEMRTIMLAAEQPWVFAGTDGRPEYDAMLDAISRIRNICYRLLP